LKVKKSDQLLKIESQNFEAQTQVDVQESLKSLPQSLLMKSRFSRLRRRLLYTSEPQWSEVFASSPHSASGALFKTQVVHCDSAAKHLWDDVLLYL